jgi:hypothetical protein
MAAYLLRISFHVNQLGFLFDFQGLLKARSILNEDFGSVHLYICNRISIRDLSVGKIDRVLHGLEPR